MKQLLAFIWIFFAFGISVSAQPNEVMDVGISNKGLWISPMLRYEVTSSSSVELTLPVNWNVAFKDRTYGGNVYPFFTELRYVYSFENRSSNFQIIPSILYFLPIDHNGFGPPSTLLAPGLGMGWKLAWKKWVIRPEMSLTITRTWYTASGGMGQDSSPIAEWYYQPWPSIGLTLYR